MSKLVNCKVIFKGTVQGVGFRYTVREISRMFSVTGYIKNLMNGDVELRVEGDEDTIKEFIKEIQKEMEDYISETETNWGEYKGEFKDFSIRF
jgi:acylphosphatase